MQPIRTHVPARPGTRPTPASGATPSRSTAATVMDISEEEGALWDAYARTRPGFETIG